MSSTDRMSTSYKIKNKNQECQQQNLQNAYYQLEGKSWGQEGCLKKKCCITNTFDGIKGESISKHTDIHK